MKPTSICRSAVIVFFFMCSNASAYDSFSGGSIDPTRWRNYEFVRMHNPDEGKLQAVARSVNPGDTIRSHYRFPDPEAVTAVKSDVIINAVAVNQNQNEDATAEARLQGVFYSTKPAPSGATGDVWAAVWIGDDGGGLEAKWAVEVIDNDEATASTEIGSGVLMDQGTPLLNTVYILELEYDPSGGQFRFAIHESKGALIDSAQFDFTNRMGPAFNPFRYLSGIAYNDRAYIDASFDNIYVKTSPSGSYSLYDDGSTFDTTKWAGNQFGRQIKDGKLLSVVQSTGSQESNGLTFIDNPDYVESRIVVSSQSSIPAGGRALVRIDGYYFNDTVAPSQQTGYTGNVLAFIRLQSTGNGLSASSYVGKSLNDDESQFEDVWSKSFNGLPISYDVPYILSIDFTGTAFIFKISDGTNSATQTYDLPPGTMVYDAYNPFRRLLTRAYGDAGGGTITATFDNVRTAPLTDGWETIAGSVAVNGSPACAMVLANGQYMFTCPAGDDFGKFELDVPLDANGEITVQAFVSGLAPFRMDADPADLNMDIAMQPATPESRSPAVTRVTASDASTPAGWARITGTVTLDDLPLCAMVLANGKYKFSCGANNGVYDLTVPLDGNGGITQFVFVSGLKPFKQTFAP